MNPDAAFLEGSAGVEGLSSPQCREARWETIRFCVQFVKGLGLPRSIGEIFGFVFTSAKPVTFEEIVSGLGISNGSASHGVRYLRRAGALRVTYMERDRRDFFQAETSFRRIFSAYLAENVTLHLNDQRERISTLRQRCAAETDDRCGHLPERLDLLMSWLAQAGAAVTAAARSLHQPNQEAPTV